MKLHPVSAKVGRNAVAQLPYSFLGKKLMGMLSNLLYTSFAHIGQCFFSRTSVSRYTRMKEKTVCTASWRNIAATWCSSSSEYFAIRNRFAIRCLLHRAMLLPGAAASIIFPRNNGNRLVVNAERAMKY